MCKRKQSKAALEKQYNADASEQQDLLKGELKYQYPDSGSGSTDEEDYAGRRGGGRRRAGRADAYRASVGQVSGPDYRIVLNHLDCFLMVFPRFTDSHVVS